MGALAQAVIFAFTLLKRHYLIKLFWSVFITIVEPIFILDLPMHWKNLQLELHELNDNFNIVS